MENKILFQGVMLLITSLFGIISGLALYVWNSQRREYDRQIDELKEENKDLKRENKELRDKVENVLIPLISEARENIKKNCQAVIDMKESCKERHYGKIHDFNR